MITVELLDEATDLEQVRTYCLEESHPDGVHVAQALVRMLFGDDSVPTALDTIETIDATTLSPTDRANIEAQADQIQQVKERMPAEAYTVQAYVTGLDEVTYEEAVAARTKLQHSNLDSLRASIAIRETDLDEFCAEIVGV